MDSVSIRRVDGFGRVVAFDNFVGLFTSKAYAEEAQHIPVLRAKLREVLESEGAAPGSHDYKEIVSAFNSFPKDELFRAPVAELRAQLRLILDVKSEAAVRLFIAPDLRHGNVIALVVMPREAGSADLSRRIQDTLAAALHGTLVYFHLALGEGYTARLHFCFVADPPKTSVIRSLETAIANLARRWDDRLQEQLVKKFGPKRGRALAERWAGAFSADYQAAIDVARAVGDIEDVETLIADGRDFIVEAGPHASDGDAGDGRSDIRIVGLGDAPMLSDLMPTLQNFAIEVLSEDAHELRPRTDGKVTRAYLQVFSVQGPNSQPFAKFPGAALIADAIAAVRNGLTADDALNAVTLTAGLSWREVALLRAYLVAAFQMRLAPARLGLQRVLLLYPDVTRLLFELFTARLSFDSPASPEKIAELREAYLARLGSIENIADDRTARTLLSLVEATVRTNFFCAMPSPDPYIALKFESARIAGLPDTAPLYEIHVNSPRMEGCHLRHGRLARGGIRFSDRPDDYRTEILDLMKTQTVKNAIIVPRGAKGGFIVKPRPRQQPDPNRRRRGVQDADQRDARSHRQPHRRRPGASRARQGARQRRAVSGRRGRQRHREFLRHRQSDRNRARLLARRRVRVGRRARLRPQEAWDHGARRVGIGAAASARDGPRPRPRRADHDDRHRRHVGRRVRQRPPALAQLEAHRRLRPSPHLHRSRSRPRGQLRRTQAPVRSAALELGGLQSRAHQSGRRRFPPRPEANRAESAMRAPRSDAMPTRSTASR